MKWQRGRTYSGHVPLTKSCEAGVQNVFVQISAAYLRVQAGHADARRGHQVWHGNPRLPGEPVAKYSMGWWSRDLCFAIFRGLSGGIQHVVQGGGIFQGSPLPTSADQTPNK